MKISDIATTVGVDPNTVRNWVERFSDYFSDEAKKIGTIQRVFNETDALMIATIAKLRADNLSFEDIENRLDDGYRVEHIGVANYGVDVRMVPAAAVEQIIDASDLKTELARVTAERDRLLTILEEERQAHESTRQKLDETRDKMQERIDSLQDEIKQLMRDLGRAEGRLEEKDKD